MYRKILMPLDGSEPADHALTHEIDVASKNDAELIVLTINPPVSSLLCSDESPIIDIEEYEKTMEEIHRQVLIRAESKVKKAHPELKMRALLFKGHVPTTIIEIAKDEDVDLILMGSRGLTGLTGWLLGSKSRHVVEHCTKPILIVK